VPPSSDAGRRDPRLDRDRVQPRRLGRAGGGDHRPGSDDPNPGAACPTGVRTTGRATGPGLPGHHRAAPVDPGGSATGDWRPPPTSTAWAERHPSVIARRWRRRARRGSPPGDRPPWIERWRTGGHQPRRVGGFVIGERAAEGQQTAGSGGLCGPPLRATLSDTSHSNRQHKDQNQKLWRQKCMAIFCDENSLCGDIASLPSARGGSSERNRWGDQRGSRHLFEVFASLAAIVLLIDQGGRCLRLRQPPETAKTSSTDAVTCCWV
jgi:hypothetical protein